MALVLLGALVWAIWPASHAIAGGRIYVPIYSTINFLEDRQINLAVTISVRNLDPAKPVVINKISYFRTDGAPGHEMIDAPLLLAPMATHTLFIRQSELEGDVGPNLLIEWATGAELVTPPLVEAVMVYGASNRMFAFTSRGVEIGRP